MFRDNLRFTFAFVTFRVIRDKKVKQKKKQKRKRKREIWIRR